MKFGKTYHEFMQGQEELPRVGIKQLKKMLKRCRAEVQAKNDSFRRPQPLTCSDETEEGELERNHSVCPQHCAVCDGSFFPALLREMEAVTGCFNERARRLLELHLASGLRKYFNLLKRRMHLSHHENLMQEGKDLVTYAIINSIAMRKILKKYDKIHYSRQGQEFKTRAQVMHIEILQSPWLCELMAFYINERECKAKKKAAPSPAAELFKDCYMGVDEDGKPFLFCGLFDSLKVEIDLTCSICLDPVFDPVSLSCGHIFCFVCGCSAASVSIVDGMKAADSSARCPLCRQERVYRGAVHLDELNILLKRSCPEYWAKRARSERAERLRLAKEHWDSLSRAFTGI